MDIYKLSFKKPNGEEVAMSSFKGKAILIVNTATKCGLAPQFDGLEQLHQTYGAKGLVVIGMPSAQFFNQEPETNETMTEVCRINHGVTFQLTEKIDVNGKYTHPISAYLKQELKGGFFGSRIKWNFTKFLIDANGKPFKRYSPKTAPEKIEKDIVALLRKS